jgi:hypothetical protein
MKPLIFRSRQDSVGITYSRAFVGEYAIDLYPPLLPTLTAEEGRWLWEVFQGEHTTKVQGPLGPAYRAKSPVARGYTSTKLAALRAIRAP